MCKIFMCTCCSDRTEYKVEGFSAKLLAPRVDKRGLRALVEHGVSNSLWWDLRNLMTSSILRSIGQVIW